MLHTERNGKTQPIVSMDATHLVNMVNLVLIRSIKKVKEKATIKLLGKYAPEDMPDKQRIALGLKKPTQAAQEQAAARLEELELEMIQTVFEKYWPYILVGLCRNDTRNGVLAILQDATGIEGRVEIPGLISEVITTEDNLELESGLDVDVTIPEEDREIW
jgi:hypothetical protein